MPREQDYQAALMVELSKPEYGCTVWRQHAGKLITNRGTHTLAPVGAADLCGIVQGGMCLQIECKIRGRKRTPEQLAWAELCIRRGAVYHLAEFDPALAVREEAVRVAREISDKIAYQSCT